MAIPGNKLIDPPKTADYLDPDGRTFGLNEDWEAGPKAVNDTSEGLFYQAWHLTYADGGAYNPPMMRYDGINDYYEKLNTTASGNKVTVVARFKATSTSGGSWKYVFRANGDSGRIRCGLLIADNDHPTVAYRDKIAFFVQDTTGEACNLLSTNVVTDGGTYVLFASYDGDTGVATYYINGVDADDPGYTNRVLVPATLETATGEGEVYFGNALFGGGLQYTGDLGYCGFKNTYMTNWSDFMTGSTPKQIDETTWTEWGGQPDYWNEDGEMNMNKGSAGNMTIYGAPEKQVFPSGGTFTITPETEGDPVIVLTGQGDSIQCTLAFDNNARPTIAWEDSSNQGYLYWYDTVEQDFVITAFQNQIWGLALTLDDKRLTQQQANDILLWYTIPSATQGQYILYHRRQRDRFQTVFEMQNPAWPYIHKCGMHDELRVQLDLSTEPPS